MSGSARSPARNRERSRTGRSAATKAPSRVLALDGPEGGRRGEEAPDAVLGDHPPERAGVGRADRLALEQDRGRAGEERRVDRCRSGRRPSRRRRRPRTPRRADAVDVLASTRRARPCSRRSARTTPFGWPVVPGGVEDVERVHAADRRAGRGRGAVLRLVPVEVAARCSSARRCSRWRIRQNSGLCAASRWPRRAAACRRRCGRARCRTRRR